MSNAIQAAVKSATNVPVLVHPHPFESSAKLMAAIEGQSIAALVKKAGFPPVYNQYLRVWINDREIARADWRTTFVADGENVYIRVVPQKSGKDIFRAIAMVVITVVAYAVAGPIGGALAGKLGLGAMGTQIVTGLVAAGIATIGYLALNALVPPPGLKNNQQDEKYRLTGSSNQFAPYGNIPRVFGKRRIFCSKMTDLHQWPVAISAQGLAQAQAVPRVTAAKAAVEPQCKQRKVQPIR